MRELFFMFLFFMMSLLFSLSGYAMEYVPESPEALIGTLRKTRSYLDNAMSRPLGTESVPRYFELVHTTLNYFGRDDLLTDEVRELLQEHMYCFASQLGAP